MSSSGIEVKFPPRLVVLPPLEVSCKPFDRVYCASPNERFARVVVKLVSDTKQRLAEFKSIDAPIDLRQLIFPNRREPRFTTTEGSSRNSFLLGQTLQDIDAFNMKLFEIIDAGPVVAAQISTSEYITALREVCNATHELSMHCYAQGAYDTGLELCELGQDIQYNLQVLINMTRPRRRVHAATQQRESPPLTIVK